MSEGKKDAGAWTTTTRNHVWRWQVFGHESTTQRVAVLIESILI